MSKRKEINQQQKKLHKKKLAIDKTVLNFHQSVDIYLLAHYWNNRFKKKIFCVKKKWKAILIERKRKISV